MPTESNDDLLIFRQEGTPTGAMIRKTEKSKRPLRRRFSVMKQGADVTAKNVRAMQAAIKRIPSERGATRTKVNENQAEMLADLYVEAAKAKFDAQELPIVGKLIARLRRRQHLQQKTGK